MGASDHLQGSIQILDRLGTRRAQDEAAERAALLAGLRNTPASLSPKYFYDELGCALYGAICRLPEYYPTRTEIALFQQYRAEIAQAIGSGKQFVDLGAGDCCKAESWLPFLAPSRYVAVDIAGPEITRALTRMAQEFPGVPMLGVLTDFSRTLDLDEALTKEPVTFFYPGSSIGNFTPDEACAFLRQVQALCAVRPGSGLLIGVDSKKDKARLDAAYDDALGVTAAFNLNVLLHVNRVLGSDFDVRGFRHRGFYNAEAGRVEMHLEATRAQSVCLDGVARPFAAGERIHTENSYKYLAEEFASLLCSAGFADLSHWQAPGPDYTVFYARP
jgi:dimethylhistidine N-methyltransferase